MVLGVADNLHASAASQHCVTFRDSFRRVVGSLGMNVRADGANHVADIERIENDDGINIGQCGQDFRTFVFRNARTARALQGMRAGIRVYGHHQAAAQLFGGMQITHVANVEQIKTAVGENDFFALGSPLLRLLCELGNVEDFLRRRSQISPP
jgi:hypothetical protein